MLNSGYQKNLGYTLIELLVVLLLFSLLAGIAVPRLTTMYSSLQAANERDEVLTYLGSLNFLAFQQRRDFVLTSYPFSEPDSSETNSDDNPQRTQRKPFPFKLPANWQLRTETPITFRANGACTGGIVYLQYQEQNYQVQLEPPFCKPKI